MKILDFISIVPWTMVAQVCNLIILTVLMKKFLFKPVMEILEKRQKEIDDTYSKADNTKKDAESMKSEYETRLINAKNEASEIVKSATQRASQKSSEIVDEAIQSASTITKKAQANIEQEKKKAMEDAKNAIGSMAVAIASEVIAREVKETDHVELIENFINNVGDAS